MNVDRARLAERVARSAEPTSLRFGTIAAINAGPPTTVDVYVDGETKATSALQVLNSYFPVVGDYVVLMKRGGDLWVMGAFGEYAGVPGGGGGGGGGGGTGYSGHGPKGARGLFIDWYRDNLPGGFVGFYARDISFQVHDCPDVTDPDPGYFWSAGYGYVGTGQGAYTGWQIATRRIVWSVWDSPGAVEEFAVMSGAPPITADDIEATVFGGEGSGSALLIHNAWVKGHKYVIRHIDAGDIDGDGGKWFREYFRDETDGWEIQAGRIKNAPGNGLLSPSIGTFFESYLGWRDRPEDFPYAAVTWFAPVWNPFDVTTFPAERKIINYAGGDSWPITEYQDSPSYGQIRVETGLASLVAGGGDGSGGGGGGGGSLAREVARWSHPGALTLDIGQLGVDVLVDTMLTLCVARLAGSPTGANAEFDIILHPPGGGSASIFSIGGPLSFAPGGTHLIERVPDTLSIAGGSYLTFDRSQIGSGAPGNDIVCTLIGIPGGS